MDTVSSRVVPAVNVLSGHDLRDRICAESKASRCADHPARDLRWLPILESAFGHRAYLIEADAGDARECLPLCFVKSRLFGRFLVSLPYVNSGGCDQYDDAVLAPLVDRAVQLADELDCQHLELRHERHCPHMALTEQMTSKVHMRLSLPSSMGELWDGLKAKVRNQVRKGEKQKFSVHWGSADLLDDFYAVFSRNMRDLGTPVFGRRLFAEILARFSDNAELCVLRDGARPIAAALLLHGCRLPKCPAPVRCGNTTNPTPTC